MRRPVTLITFGGSHARVMVDLAVVHAGELVTCSGGGDTSEERLGVIEDGAFLSDSGSIIWVGTTRELTRKSLKVETTLDAEGALVTPGFVDPHTHLVFAGSREDEVERKAKGESYASILGSGGGIAKTMRDTRGSSAQEIARQSGERLGALVNSGVTTAEVKTGYGQSVESELKMLGAIALLRRASGADLIPTFLGLHAEPPEFKGEAEYVKFAIKQMLPAVMGAENPPVFSDCFCEEGFFTVDSCRSYLNASSELGLRPKIHADEFAESGGAALAAELRCVSADHLVKSRAEGIDGMAKSGTVAVLLPGTSLLSRIPFADARKIIDSGCRVALGTDLSPNSWVESPQIVMSLACSGLRMTPAEALLGFTRHSAAAVGRDDVGALRVGSRGDFVVHSLPSYRHIPYRVGGSYVSQVYRRGKKVAG